jgi:chromate reductase
MIVRPQREQPLVNLLFFSGSSQVGSVNARLAFAVAELVRRSADAAVTTIDLSDFDLPNYAQAGQSGALAADAVTLRGLLQGADGVFLSSDEYTGAYSAVFRNAVGWLTDEREGAGSVLRGKPVALCGASGGGVGALRGQPALAQLLREVGAEVISQQLELGTSPGPFDPQGQLLPKVERQLLGGCLARLLDAARQRRSEDLPR